MDASILYAPTAINSASVDLRSNRITLLFNSSIEYKKKSDHISRIFICIKNITHICNYIDE